MSVSDLFRGPEGNNGIKKHMDRERGKLIHDTIWHKCRCSSLRSFSVRRAICRQRPYRIWWADPNKLLMRDESRNCRVSLSILFWPKKMKRSVIYLQIRMTTLLTFFAQSLDFNRSFKRRFEQSVKISPTLSHNLKVRHPNFSFSRQSVYFLAQIVQGTGYE